MNPILYVAAAVPLLSTAMGYGAGTMLPEPAPAVAVSEMDRVEQLLDSAEENGRAPLHVATPAAAQSSDVVGGTPGEPKPRSWVVRTDSGALVTQYDTGTPETLTPEVVQLGRMMVPVYRSATVTYVVAEFGVVMEDSDAASRYRVAANATRLRDAILQSFRTAAEHPNMKRAALDSDWLSRHLTQDLRADFAQAREVLLLNLIKKDVPRT